MRVMKIVRSEVIVPKGSYVIGDPCYAVADDDWFPLLQSCNYFEDPVGTIKDETRHFSVLGFGTKWGDGSYHGSDGNVYPVDAGLIGLVPVELLDDLSGHQVVNFSKDTLCINDGSGKLKFGHITIDTDPSDEEDEDENY